VVFEGQDAPGAFGDVEWVLDRGVEIEDFVVSGARRGIDQAALPAADDRAVAPIAAAGAGIG